jgi:hypothetical protein
MGKNPAFQFYPGDWTRDLDDQDLEIEGAWIRICCRLWWADPRGEMTKPLKEWARILRKTERKTSEILKILLEKGIASGSVLDNQMVNLISRRIKRDSEISQIRYKVGLLGGNPALKKLKENLDNQTSNQNVRSSSSTSSSIKKNKHIAFEIPEWITKETWAAFKEMRKIKRAPLTDRASTLIVKELLKLQSEGHNPESVLNQSIMKSWTGVFPLKTGGNGGLNQGFNRQHQREEKYDPELEEIKSRYNRLPTELSTAGKAGNVG